MTFAPRLEILPAGQRALWPELAAVPRGFVLYGGTGLALRFGHRPSVDFDFFSHDALDHRRLEALSFMREATTLQEAADTRTVLVPAGDIEVKVSFFGDIAFGRVGEPEPTDDGVLRTASVLDLGGTKIEALLQRIESKDYRDIAVLLAHGVELASILGAARALFGPAFNPLVAQKALCYFEGGDLTTLSPEVRARLLAAAAHDLETRAVPVVSSRLD